MVAVSILGASLTSSAGSLGVSWTHAHKEIQSCSSGEGMARGRDWQGAWERDPERPRTMAQVLVSLQISFLQLYPLTGMVDLRKASIRPISTVTHMHGGDGMGDGWAGGYSLGRRPPHSSQYMDSGRLMVPQSPHTSSSLTPGGSPAPCLLPLDQRLPLTRASIGAASVLALLVCGEEEGPA